jgi:hypothetical protein
MSWDIWLEIDTGGPLLARLGEGYNYTYNTNPMLRRAEIIKESCNEWIGLSASEFCERLEAGIKKLEESPADYKTLNPKNGWGDYDSLLSLLREILADFSQHPKAKIGGWL